MITVVITCFKSPKLYSASSSRKLFPITCYHGEVAWKCQGGEGVSYPWHRHSFLQHPVKVWGVVDKRQVVVPEAVHGDQDHLGFVPHGRGLCRLHGAQHKGHHYPTCASKGLHISSKEIWVFLY